MTPRCFIKSVAQVSCQSPLSDDWMVNPVRYEESYIRAIEPDITSLIPKSEARRMSRILKRTMATSLTALGTAGISIPDAIITGTGMGCLENSEKFLADLAKYGENCLKPTLFMQSTHNTISSLIAIQLKCHGYNNTYSHRAASFDSAMLDAFIQLKSRHIESALVGAHDEVTPLFARILKETIPDYGFISETSVSTVIASAPDDALCELKNIRVWSNPKIQNISETVLQWIECCKYPIIITGINNIHSNDAPYIELLKKLPERLTVLKYRDIFGDNFSSPAMGYYIGVRILENSTIPESLTRWNDTCIEADCSPTDVIIFNHSESRSFSAIHLSSV